jgi:HEAT repeat protein
LRGREGIAMSLPQENPLRRTQTVWILNLPLVEALHALLRCDNEELRVRAIPPLGSLRHPSSLPLLAHELSAETTRLSARAALLRIGTSPSLTLLHTFLKRDLTHPFSLETLVLLGSFPTPEAVDLLLEWSRNPAPKVRRSAVQGLAGHGPGEAVELRILELLEDKDKDVAVAALVALRQVGSERALVPLLQLLRSSKNLFVRSTSLLTLGALAPLEANAEAKRFLKDPDPRLRASAVEALGMSLRDRVEDAPFFLEALEDSANRVRGNAIASLWELDPDACRRPFLDLLKSSVPVNRATATWTAGDTQAPELFQALLPTLTTESDPGVQAMTLRVLEEARNPELLKVLVPLLDHPNRKIRLAGTHAFGRLARPVDRHHLAQRLEREQDSEILGEMLRILGSLSDASNFVQLLPFLEHRDSALVATTLEALARVGDLAVRPLIEDHQEHPEPLVRLQALEALFRLGEVQTLEHLVRFFKEADPSLLPLACQTAEEIGEDLYLASQMQTPLPFLSASLDTLRTSTNDGLEELSSPPKTPAFQEDRSGDWELLLAKTLQEDPVGEQRTELAISGRGGYLARYLSQRSGLVEGTPEDHAANQAQNFLPGLLLDLEEAKRRSQDPIRIQELYLELAEAHLHLYRDLLNQARKQAREGAGGAGFRILGAFFQQIKLTPDLQRHLGSLYLELRDYQSAFDHLLPSACTAPDDIKLLLQLCEAALHCHKFKVAEALLKQLLPRLPEGSASRQTAEKMLTFLPTPAC